jgi:hypothetical protein
MEDAGESDCVDGQHPVRRARREWWGLAAVVVVASVGVGAVVISKNRGEAAPPVPTLAVVHVPGVTTRLVVPHRSLRAGSTMRATVVVTNTTGRPIKSVDCIAPFAVSLRNRNVGQEIAFALCATEFTFPVGRSTFPVTISASYDTCTNVAGSGDASVPECIREGVAPNLPKGTYHAFVLGQENVVSSAAPVEIRVD